MFLEVDRKGNRFIRGLGEPLDQDRTFYALLDCYYPFGGADPAQLVPEFLSAGFNAMAYTVQDNRFLECNTGNCGGHARLAIEVPAFLLGPVSSFFTSLSRRYYYHRRTDLPTVDVIIGELKDVIRNYTRNRVF